MAEETRLEAKRLYDTFHPEHYDVYLDISRKDKKFSGKVTITGEELEDTIKLNQKFLDIKAVKVNDAAVEFDFNNEDEVINIISNQTGNV